MDSRVTDSLSCAHAPVRRRACRGAPLRPRRRTGRRSPAAGWSSRWRGCPAPPPCPAARCSGPAAAPDTPTPATRQQGRQAVGCVDLMPEASRTGRCIKRSDKRLLNICSSRKSVIVNAAAQTVQIPTACCHDLQQCLRTCTASRPARAAGTYIRNASRWSAYQIIGLPAAGRCTQFSRAVHSVIPKALLSGPGVCRTQQAETIA